MKILIIEDDADTRIYIKTKLLERGCIVDDRADGLRGLQAAQTGNYDIILLDYGLPEKNGFEICRMLRQAGDNTPIIMLSIMTEVPTKIEGLSVGADDYLTKPFFFEELFARIQTVLRRPQTIKRSTMTVADMSIDFTNQSITRGDKDTVYLTRKEFLLLEYLARNPGDVVPRNEIAERVWESSLNPFSNTIETHVLNLRRKVDRGHKKQLIHCIPGRGYKLGL